MNDEHESSYYEIALTNRQVMSVFVVLLVCVVAAFFSGVWIGRNGAVFAEPAVATQSIEAGVEDGEQPLRPIGFFGDGTEANTPAAGAPEEMPTAERRDDTPSATDVDPDSVATETKKGPAARSEKRKTAAPEPRATVARTEPAPAAADSSSAEGPLVIQVFSSHDDVQASKVLRRLAEDGYRAEVSSIEVDGQTMYRVRIGPFAERADAETVAAKVRDRHKLQTWITR